MSIRYIATVLITAAAIAGASALPARAGNDDVGKVIAGVAGVIVLGTILNELSDHDRDKAHRHHDRPRYGHPPRKHHNKLVPRDCLRKVHSYHTRYAVSKRCLQRAHLRIERLPDSCRMTWRGNHGHDRGYAMRCLMQHGYRVAEFRRR